MADAAPSEGSGAAQAVETSGNSFAAVMDIEQIKKVLPHRHALGQPVHRADPVADDDLLGAPRH